MPSSTLVATLTHAALHLHTSEAAPLKLPDPLTAPTALAVYPDSTRLVEGSSSGSVLLRDLPSLDSVATLTSAVPSRVTALAVSHTSHLLAAAHKDGSVSLYNPVTHALHATLSDSGPVLALAFPPVSDPRHLASVTAHHVTLFSPSTFRRNARLVLPSAPSRSYSRSPVAAAKLTAAAFSPLHPALLAATDDTGGVTVWDVAKHVVSRSNTTGRAAQPTSSSTQEPTPPHARFFASLRAPAVALAFCPDGTLLVAGFDKHVRVFDPDLTRLIFTAPAPAPTSALACAPAGRVALGLTDGSVVLALLDVNAKTLRTTQQIRIPAPHAAPSLAVRAVSLFSARPPLAVRRRGRKQLAPPLQKGTHPQSTGVGTTGKTPPTAPVLESLDDVLTRLSGGTRSSGGSVGVGVSGVSGVGGGGGGAGAGGILASGGGSGDGGGADDADLFSPVSKRTPQPPGSPPGMMSLGASKFAASAETARLRRSRTVETMATPSQAASRAARISGVERFQNNTTDEESGAAGSSDSVLLAKFSPRESGGGKNSGTGDVNDPALPQMSAEVPRIRKVLSEMPGSRVDVGGVRDVVDGSPRRMRSVVDGERKRGAERGAESGGATEDDAARRAGPRHDRAAPPLGGASGQGNGGGPVRKEGDVGAAAGDLTGAVRDIMKTAVDELRTDLRSDILAIHSEMVMMEARHTAELRAMIVERDEGMARMREEMTRLRSDNERLRVKYGLR